MVYYGVYGGLVQIDLDDIDDLLRRFNVQEHVIGTWTRNDITKVLDEIADATDGGRFIAEHFAIYDAARTAILPYLRALIAEPLVIAAHSEVGTKLLAAVDAYEVLTDSIREHYDGVFDVVGSDIDETNWPPAFDRHCRDQGRAAPVRHSEPSAPALLVALHVFCRPSRGTA